MCISWIIKCLSKISVTCGFQLVTVTDEKPGAALWCMYINLFNVYLSRYLTNLMHKICFTISFISCLSMLRAHVLIIRRSKLHYTASGIITSIGGRHVISRLYMFRAHVLIIGGSKLHYTASGLITPIGGRHVISSLYMFRAHVLIIRRSKLHYTASGIITPIGGRHVISCLYMFRAHVLIIRRSKLHYTASGIITFIGGCHVHGTATYRYDDTRGCVMQF